MGEVIPLIDDLFNRIAGREGYPLVEYAGRREWIYGVIIEDTDESVRRKELESHGRDWLVNSNGKAAYVRFEDQIYSESFDMVSVTIAVNDLIKRSSINHIMNEIKKIYRSLT